MGDSRETPTSYWKYKQEFSDLQNTHKNLKLSCEENLLMYNITHLAAFFNCFLCTCRKIPKGCFVSYFMHKIMNILL
ncbi:MAG TPA: hypothetical protein DCZ91_24035 [Lachnospiraceae bacterium]|nr:hypothetical protein [Lachnospiraceae bacterium]